MQNNDCMTKIVGIEWMKDTLDCQASTWGFRWPSWSITACTVAATSCGYESPFITYYTTILEEK